MTAELASRIPNHPKTCGGVTSPAWSAGQCRLCWLATYDDRYAAKWGIRENRLDIRRANPLDCLQRGTVAIGSYSCGCATMARTPVYSCPVYGLCADENSPKVVDINLSTGETITQRVVGCKTCPVRQTSTPLDNPHVPTVAAFPVPQIQPAERIRVDESKWPKADRHFQLSICRRNGRLYSAHRLRWSMGRVVLSELDERFQVVRCRQMDPPRSQVNATADEDPRLFVWRGSLWCYHTAWDSTSSERNGKRNCTTPCLSRVNDDLTISETRVVSYAARRGWEKNWGFFRWDDGLRDRLFAIYQPSAGGVVLELDDFAARFACRFDPQWPAQLGLARGGSPPILIGDELVTVCHAVYRDVPGRQWYSATLLTLATRPPFTPLRYLPFPLIDPRIEGRTEGVSTNPRVVFPCGSTFDGERFDVSLGWHDRWCEVWRFDWREIERQLVAFSGASTSLPSLPSRAFEYSEAMAAWIAAGRPERADADVARINAVCRSNQCGRWRDGHCGECGCPVNDGPAWANKARMATEPCPLGFWA